MATIQFNEQSFRTQFPAFSSIQLYSSSLLNMTWSNATAFLSNQITCGWYGGMNRNQQTLALNYMTAHLLALSALAASGEQGGIVTSATIDKVSVTIQPPPEKNQWQWWLNQTAYGSELLALLQVAAAGGRFFGARAVLTAFRR